jgi:hypothetical protein
VLKKIGSSACWSSTATTHGRNHPHHHLALLGTQGRPLKTYDIDPAVTSKTYSPTKTSKAEPPQTTPHPAGILEGKITGTKRDIVLINSARLTAFRQPLRGSGRGIRQSAQAIDSGAALDKLEKRWHSPRPEGGEVRQQSQAEPSPRMNMRHDVDIQHLNSDL